MESIETRERLQEAGLQSLGRTSRKRWSWGRRSESSRGGFLGEVRLELGLSAIGLWY